MSEKKRHVRGEKPSAGEHPIAHFSYDEHSPQVVAEQVFQPTEMRMLLPLVRSYPDYAPNELLLASFSGGTTEEEVHLARERLWRAKERGEWDEIMRPMRNALSRVRQKLITLHLDVRSIFETGYTLIPYTEGQYRRMRRS